MTGTIQTISITHCSLGAVFLLMAPTVGKVGRTYIPRTGDTVRNLGLSMSSLTVNLHPLDDLLQHLANPRNAVSLTYSFGDGY